MAPKEEGEKDREVWQAPRALELPACNTEQFTAFPLTK